MEHPWSKIPEHQWAWLSLFHWIQTGKAAKLTMKSKFVTLCQRKFDVHHNHFIFWSQDCRRNQCLKNAPKWKRIGWASFGTQKNGKWYSQWFHHCMQSKFHICIIFPLCSMSQCNWQLVSNHNLSTGTQGKAAFMLKNQDCVWKTEISWRRWNFHLKQFPFDKMNFHWLNCFWQKTEIFDTQNLKFASDGNDTIGKIQFHCVNQFQWKINQVRWKKFWWMKTVSSRWNANNSFCHFLMSVLIGKTTIWQCKQCVKCPLWASHEHFPSQLLQATNSNCSQPCKQWSHLFPWMWRKNQPDSCLLLFWSVQNHHTGQFKLS